MPERRMPQIVAERNRFGQILIERQSTCNGAGNLGNLEGMRQTGTIMIALRGKKNLRLMLEAPEGFAVQDPVAIDSVGYAFLLNGWPHVVAETGLAGGAEDYLHEAALANQPPSLTQYQPDGAGRPLTSSLGVHEHWNNPQDKKYSRNLGSGNGIELVAVKLGSRNSR